MTRKAEEDQLFNERERKITSLVSLVSESRLGNAKRSRTDRMSSNSSRAFINDSKSSKRTLLCQLSSSEKKDFLGISDLPNGSFSVTMSCRVSPRFSREDRPTWHISSRYYLLHSLTYTLTERCNMALACA